MDALDLLRDLSSRPRHAAASLRADLDPASHDAAAFDPAALDPADLDTGVLGAHPGGHDNSLAWLLWHTGREVDAQLADLTGAEQVWRAQGFDERFGLGEDGDTVGYGHTPEQARGIVVEDGADLLEYVDAALAAVEDHLGTLTAEDLDEIVDDQWDPPVTRGARLVSILDDAIQHLAQAAYVLGMPHPS